MSRADHKRNVRDALAPARVTVDAEQSIWIVVDDIVGKNEGKRHKAGRFFIEPATSRYRDAVAEGARVMNDAGTDRVVALAWPGPWHADILGVWPRQRDRKRLGMASDAPAVPVGDVDAGVSQALDAIQRAGIIDDDCRVLSVRAWTTYRKDVRATVMRLARPDAFPTSLAAMLAMLDAAKETSTP